MNSKLMLGNVWHTRPRSPSNAFRYRVLYVSLDLAEVDQLSSELRLFGRNTRKVYSVNDRDHIGAHDGGFASAARAMVRELSPALSDAPITFVTQPSILGYVFNPVSFFMVGTDVARPDLILAEVHNRRSGRHVYPLFPSVEGDSLTARFAKDFYVSPFQPMDASYRFAASRDVGRISLGFDLLKRGELLLGTGLELEERPLTDGALAKAMFTHPFVPQKTLAMIYWQALKLKVKGARFHSPPVETREDRAHANAR